MIVTRGPDRAVQRDTTGVDGLFDVRWSEGTGDYLLYVSVAGYAPFRRRLLREGSDSVFTVQVVLAPLVAQLAAVAVRAERPRPRRGDNLNPATAPDAGWGAEDQRLLPPDQEGDLDAVAAMVPGIIRTDDGVSAFGLGAGQNQTTLDGLTFAGGHIPREAAVSKRVVTSPYDPARGGFSGAQIALGFFTGSLFSRANASGSLDAPALQLSSAASRALGAPYTNVRVSGGADGPWGRTDAFRYNVAGEMSRRTSDAVSLFSASDNALRLTGVSPDSVAAIASALTALGVPLDAGMPNRRATEQLTLIGRFDRTGFDWNSRQDRPHSGALTAYAQFRRSRGIGVGSTIAATAAGEARGETLALQALYSGLLGAQRDRLLELRSGVSIRRDQSESQTGLPTGIAFSGTDASPTAPGAFTSVLFGGSPFVDRRGTAWTWESAAEAQWFAHARHRIKVTAGSRFDGVTNQSAANQLGTFTFLSLADLAAGQAASFTRTLDPMKRTGTVWNGALSVADFWRPSPALELVLGARLDVNRFLDRPPDNADVSRAFGFATGTAPQRVGVSPRFGFSWRYRREAAAAVPGPFAALGVVSTRPAGLIRGGFGLFRSAYAPGLIADARAFAAGSARLICVGDAVPIPDWPAYSAGHDAIPRECAGEQSVADAAPDVLLLDRSYDVPQTWRSNLNWTRSWRRIGVSIDGAFSLNRRQPGTLDLNLLESQVGVLPSEGGRPLYAELSAIVPSTGRFPATAGRADTLFGRVTSVRNDLVSQSRQLTFGVRPELGANAHLALHYTLASVRGEQRGLDFAGFFDPRGPEWARTSLDIRHHIVVSGGRSIAPLGGTRVTLSGIVQSGLPYTPLVAGDVNGDGYSNDRAFIHSSASAGAAGDTELAAGMNELLASAPSHARRCLQNQLDLPAARNSCEGPWSATVNARLDLPLRFIRVGVGDRRRARAALNIANVAAGIDQLLHGSSGVRGWGAAALPNQVLYTVTGFDPSAQRFRYAINPRFGRTEPQLMFTRAPFRVTLDVSIDLSTPVEVQQVDRFLAPGRTRPGVPLDSAALHARYAGNVPNVIQLVRRDADSLFLSREQLEALDREEAPYLQRVNLIWGRMASEFAALPVRFDARAALLRQEEFIAEAWAANRDAARTIQRILTPAQIELAHATVRYLIHETGPVRLRILQ